MTTDHPHHENPQRDCITLDRTPRAILKLAGRGAFALAAAAFDLFGWLFSAVWALFGFAAAVKRITERTTERYLRWRKRRRARVAAASISN